MMQAISSHKLHVKKLNFFQQAIGLMGKKKPEALFLQTRFGIHTLGVAFPIDVVILNQQNIVVTLKQNLQPNSFFVWNFAYNKVIELPSGEIEKMHVKIGDSIEINFN